MSPRRVNGIGFDQLLALGLHEIEQGICQFNLAPFSVLCGHAAQRGSYLSDQMASEVIGAVVLFKRSDQRFEASRRLAIERLAEALRDQLIVETLLEFLHQRMKSPERESSRTWLSGSKLVHGRLVYGPSINL